MRHPLARRLILLLALLAGAVAWGTACREEAGPSGQKILRMNISGSGQSGRVARELAAQYEAETGVRVDLVMGPINATERFSHYLQYLGARTPAIDVYQIDVIWPGMLAPWFVDLGPAMEGELDDFFPAMIENNTVGGALVAVPWHVNAGMLFYRRDLVEGYGFDGPPQTWDELESMARTIQHGERAKGNGAFWGFLWQGAPHEALTCNALEWQVSQGGGRIVEADGSISIANAKAAAAFDRAAGWIGSITPPSVLEEAEVETLRRFRSGEAAFLRHWPYAWADLALAEADGVGRFGAVPLPAGEAGRASTLGGWHLGVSVHSRQREEAERLVRWMTSRSAQLQRATGGNLLPTRQSVYAAEELRAAVPFVEAMREALESAVPRPSSLTGEHYGEVSASYHRHVHAVLRGDITGEEAVRRIESDILDALRGR
jgi:trehalose/maltose transport system substrate-binding protein